MAEPPASERKYSYDRANEEDLTVIHNCYCPNCGNGKAVTTMLPTHVPAFREILIMNLSCADCSFRNSEVSFVGEIQTKGEKLILTVTDADDLNRQIIKSDSASLLIPALEFEIPPFTQRGIISTLEGVLQTAASALESQQPERLRLGDIENFRRCNRVIRSLRRLSLHESFEDDEEDEGPVFPFVVILDDPAGNSFVENPLSPNPDPQLKSEKYFRSATQDLALGLQPSTRALQDGNIDDTNPRHKNPLNDAKDFPGLERLAINRFNRDEGIGREEAMTFPTACPSCYDPNAETKMCIIDVPHFKEVIIMSMLCDHCGFRSNDIKTGGAIPKHGCKITVSVSTYDDLTRDVLKSDTAGIFIPEIDLELSEGTLNGVYTTVEGLLKKIHERLLAGNPFGSGDSTSKHHATNDGENFSPISPIHARYQSLLAKIREMASGNILPFTLIITDPLANSFVGPPGGEATALYAQAERDGENNCCPEHVDFGVLVEEFERSHQQNEDLGLNDMKTENYQNGEHARQ